MRKMRRKKKTGSRLLIALCACALVCLGGDKKKVDAYAIVGGTVFRDSGLSLPGATVTLVPKDNPIAKKQQAVSDARGEFAFRVPTAPATYVLKASLKGFHQGEKEATVGGEGRVDVTFMLAPESN
jgi:hypothetical protein